MNYAAVVIGAFRTFVIYFLLAIHSNHPSLTTQSPFRASGMQCRCPGLRSAVGDVLIGRLCLNSRAKKTYTGPPDTMAIADILDVVPEL